MQILAIDPGNVQSAYAILDKQLKPVHFEIVPNEDLLQVIQYDIDYMAIEMIASYGMAVGVTVFETVFWIGRFWEAARQQGIPCTKVYRKDVKMNLCQSMRAKDSNIRQALIDRFGVVGTKKNQGWFYGFKKDLWAAYAVGVTFSDMSLK